MSAYDRFKPSFRLQDIQSGFTLPDHSEVEGLQVALARSNQAQDDLRVQILLLQEHIRIKHVPTKPIKILLIRCHHPDPEKSFVVEKHTVGRTDSRKSQHAPCLAGCAFRDVFKRVYAVSSIRSISLRCWRSVIVDTER